MGYLKKYIRGLEYDQVSASLMSGEITLHAFELEIDAIREWVDTILPYTTEITRAYCSMAVVKIPWTQLRYKPVCITIPSLELDCTVHDMYDDVEWNCKVALAQREALLEQHINSAVSNIDDEAKRSLRRNTELGWWDFIMAGLQLRIESVSINLFTRSPSRITGMDDDAEPTKNPTRAFKIFLQGVFMAPCIQQGPFLEPSSSEEWSGLSYVDSPQEAFQFNRERNFLRTMRLYTINSLSVICAITGESLIEHTGGIRIKHRAESIAVERGTHGKRWSKLPFTCGGGLSIWLDELKVKGARSTVGKLYNIFNDLTQPTYIPIDNLPKNARYLQGSGYLRVLWRTVLSSLRELSGPPFKDDIAGNLPKVPEYESVVRPYRHDYKHPSNPNEVMKSASHYSKKMFKESKKVGNAMMGQVLKNASKSQKTLQKATKSMMNPQAIGPQSHRRSSHHAKDEDGNVSSQKEPEEEDGETPPPPPPPEASDIPAASPTTEADGDDEIIVVQEGTSPDDEQLVRTLSSFSDASSEGERRRRSSSSGESFQDACSDHGRSGDEEADEAENEREANERYASYDERASGVNEATKRESDDVEGFALWTDEDEMKGADSIRMSELRILDKVCEVRFNHYHINEFVVEIAEEAKEQGDGAVSTRFVFREYDQSSQNENAYGRPQLVMVACFASQSEKFIQIAKSLCSRVLCPFEPVASTSIITSGQLLLERGSRWVLRTRLPGHHPGAREAVEGDDEVAKKKWKGLTIKWRSKNQVPARFLACTESTKSTGKIEAKPGDPQFEASYARPLEGCLHGFTFNGDAAWGQVTGLINGLIAGVGQVPENADESLLHDGGVLSPTAAAAVSDGLDSVEPEWRMRLCMRDTMLSLSDGSWRIAVPNALVTRAIPQGSVFDIMAQLPMLAGVPDCHYSASSSRRRPSTATTATVSRRDSLQLEVDQGFQGCVCGQEAANQPWLIGGVYNSESKSGSSTVTRASSSMLPGRIMFEGKEVLERTVLSSRAWRYSPSVTEESLLVSRDEFQEMMQQKLEVVELRSQLKQATKRFEASRHECEQLQMQLKDAWLQEIAIPSGGSRAEISTTATAVSNGSSTHKSRKSKKIKFSSLMSGVTTAKPHHHSSGSGERSAVADASKSLQTASSSGDSEISEEDLNSGSVDLDVMVRVLQKKCSHLEMVLRDLMDEREDEMSNTKMLKGVVNEELTNTRTAQLEESAKLKREVDNLRMHNAALDSMYQTAVHNHDLACAQRDWCLGRLTQEEHSSPDDSVVLNKMPSTLSTASNST
ncbi:hypothetical protein FOZ60_003665 [Perkinsus olseni]|uniref:UHRF1 binding protein 1 n=2 Tax=Perkinsus olseni TaxID=32597 RepID=A0A7J6PHG0_PEROL|nr:hypothetical protein FOZ60_003665 [Perkinsus olseni]